MSDQAPTIVSAPRFYGSTFQQLVSGNDFMIVVGQGVPTVNGGGFGDPMTQAVAIVSMSPQSAKELALLLQGGVDEYEKLFGELRTPFTIEKTK